MVRRRLVSSRAAAQQALAERRVVVRGLAEPKPSSLVSGDTPLRLTGPSPRFVGRGGDKLEAALDVFPVPVAGRRCLDAGASTGGFTDCLLQREAALVVAVDVGYGQLADAIRRHPRVEVVERTNLRHADPGELGAPFDVVVADLSFISLVTVADALFALGNPGTDYVLLVKPQFELGPDQVGKGGVVRDRDLHVEALERVVAGLDRAGLGARAVTASPVVGAKGNREFFLWCRHGEGSLRRAELVQVTS